MKNINNWMSYSNLVPLVSNFPLNLIFIFTMLSCNLIFMQFCPTVTNQFPSGHFKFEALFWGKTSWKFHMCHIVPRLSVVKVDIAWGNWIVTLSTCFHCSLYNARTRCSQSVSDDCRGNIMSTSSMSIKLFSTQTWHWSWSWSWGPWMGKWWHRCCCYCWVCV